jgi:phosphatidylserine decarboxylase
MSEILLYNREKQSLEKEVVSGKKLLKFMYSSKVGLKLTNKVLKKKAFSTIYGNLFKKEYSKSKIASFIKEHNINVSEIEGTLEQFNSFNEFFIRKLKPSARPLNLEQNIFISPADARLIVYPINEDLIIPVKGINFTIQALFKNESLVEKYKNGLCMVFRLAPADYHRFCYMDEGEHSKALSIGKYLHSVNPYALEQNLPVFTENIREYCELKTKNFEELMFMEVGALGVSKIVQNYPNGTNFVKGQEKGYFEFGGSTIIVLVKQNIIKIDTDIADYSSVGIETLVKYGSSIAKRF